MAFGLREKTPGLITLSVLFPLENKLYQAETNWGLKYPRIWLDSVKRAGEIVAWKDVFFKLNAVDTIGNCQRLAFTVGVSQHMHKITNL